MKIQQLLYRQRVVYAIIEYTKSDKTEKQFKNIEEFWLICARLQIKNRYAPAEYWYILNELFNSINLIFFLSTIISFMTGHWIFGIIYFLLTIFAFKRARQYADHFIQTVCNLTIVHKIKILP
jgi:acyl-coenzyme A synthetase/AMP-(fatty) acid ligase